ncbi:MAG: DNA-3-methyladenine glycosylase [Syntrophorhabdaceae bacterium PtaU1.Bin034]|nr:MAG: DNA-3-methyladenine glycosylase [Syntrophorhabdaceae bacterium PtaU1.Bin034]
MGAKAVEVSVSQPASSESADIQVHVRGTGPTKGAESVVTALLGKTLGIRQDLSGFYAIARNDPRLGSLAARFFGLKPPRFPTVFEAVVNGIACQQLSLNVGITLLNRLSEACALSFVDGRGDSRYAFPRPQDLLKLRITDFRKMGFSTRKAEFLLGLADAVSAGRIDVERLAAVDRKTAMESLVNIRGIGRWTAEYVLLRGVGDLSAFPGDDVGGRNKLGRWLGIGGPLSYDAVQKVTSKWRPFPGLIYFHLLLDELARQGYIEEKISSPHPFTVLASPPETETHAAPPDSRGRSGEAAK